MIARETFFYHGRSRGVTWKSGREQGELVEGEVCERLAGRDEISWFLFFLLLLHHMTILYRHILNNYVIELYMQ